MLHFPFYFKGKTKQHVVVNSRTNAETEAVTKKHSSSPIFYYFNFLQIELILNSRITNMISRFCNFLRNNRCKRKCFYADQY